MYVSCKDSQRAKGVDGICNKCKHGADNHKGEVSVISSAYGI